MNTRTYQFYQVDVFSDVPLLGNALAVVVDADDMTDEEMHRFARWTNLSETTFLLKPQDPRADYRVRIFTPDGELPFAGHPTLGTCYVWRETQQFNDKRDIIQECGVGMVTIRQQDNRLAFAAPALLRGGDTDPQQVAYIVKALGLRDEDVVRSAWVDNGPGWIGLQLTSVEKVLAAKPDYSLLDGYDIGLCALYDDQNGPVQLEVRALCCSLGEEDPVTGSLNASLAQWLTGEGILPECYVAGQGQVISRDGKIFVTKEAGQVWVAGDVTCVITGQAALR
ncbi:PhzF family phenazine biosynthesis protein [Morganella morganii]|uniref:PhzF family phenazine biosynthesis protein n=1 Tax=Morganella morganii TaxID=582 RepID=UPI0021D2D8A2|nr:PhzF family phenazine biosynthesis protein [Morganella morganii]MCU6353546.1 PhzF family phenazine biosynthesis protein [Morganella morganii]